MCKYIHLGKYIKLVFTKVYIFAHFKEELYLKYDLKVIVTYNILS